MNRGYNENMELRLCSVLCRPGASKSFSQDDSIYSVLMPAYCLLVIIHGFSNPSFFWKKLE